MRRLVSLSFMLAIAILTLVVTTKASDSRVNESTPGLIWSTGKGHSDPAKLKETAKSVQHLSDDELKKRQIEIQELVEKLRMPSDIKLMKTTIDNLNNASLSFEDCLRALEELLIFVEVIDNANAMNKLGGLAAVIKHLDNDKADVRKLAAWVIGKASQNNPVVQQQVLDLGTLAKLMKMVKSDIVEEANKALYAVSALTRNNFNGQEIFYSEAADIMLKDIMSNSTFDIRLRRKCVFLIGDLVECQLENVFSDQGFLKAIVDLLLLDDLDLREKTLTALKNLLLLRTTEASVLKEFCGLDKALENTTLKLQQLMEDEDQRDYAMDVEVLRQDV